MELVKIKTRATWHIIYTGTKEKISTSHKNTELVDTDLNKYIIITGKQITKCMQPKRTL